MTAFTIDSDNNITAHASRKAARETGEGVFATEEQFADLIGSDAKRLVEIWNSLTGVKPVTKFKDRKTARWESVIGVTVERVFVQRMRTKWGSCSRTSASIRLNTDLAKKPPECLEYIVVHEMAHLIEPTHNSRFIELMDRLMPNWRFYRQLLNRLPVRHENWEY